MPTLDFNPEPLESLKARFPKAIDTIWGKIKTEDRPGMYREHVFDFEDGLRMIISREVLIDPEPVIHVSASWANNRPPRLKNVIIEIVTGKYRSLTDGLEKLELVYVTSGGIPHFFVREPTAQ